MVAEHDSWVRVMADDEITNGSMIQVEISDLPIALYRLDSGELFATDAYCTHGAASLADGFLDGDVVECPLHAGCFEVRTGKGLGDPIEADLAIYPVKVVDGSIYVDCRALRP